MFNPKLIAAFLIALAVAVPATASAAPAKTGAIVYSMVTVDKGGDEVGGKKTEPKAPEGGLYAVRDHHLNQLTEDPTDTEPAFSADGTTIAFVRSGDIYAMRADGSGQRRLTSGTELDSRPLVSPDGRVVVFERRTAADQPRDLYTVKAGGAGLHRLTSSAADDHEASFAPDGRSLVFVRSVASTGGGTADDIYSVRPSGAGLARLTNTGRDDFAPRDLGKTIVFSRGESSEGPSAFADIFTMRSNGTKARKLIAGVGSAYVEDATANGRTLLFRRDQGLWVKQLGGKGRKLAELPDQAKTNAVFSSDGRQVAAFTATEDEEALSVINVATGHRTYVAAGSFTSGGVTATIGPVIAWQPVRR
jgi:dipeptidyl aminopeptidase/acylaminoacyl peptidase